MKTGSHMILFPCRWEVTWYHYSTRNRHHFVKILWCRIILYNYLDCPILSGELLVIGNLVLPEYSLLKSVEAHAMHLHIVQHSFSLMCAGLAAVFLWRLVWGGQRWTPSVVWRQPHRLAGWGKRGGRGRGGEGRREGSQRSNVSHQCFCHIALRLVIVCAEHYYNVALSTGLIRAATREDIIKFKCMQREQMMHKCKEFSAKVSQSVYQMWELSDKPAACLSVENSHLLSSRKAGILRLSLLSSTLSTSTSRNSSPGRELGLWEKWADHETLCVCSMTHKVWWLALVLADLYTVWGQLSWEGQVNHCCER